MTNQRDRMPIGRNENLRRARGVDNSLQFRCRQLIVQRALDIRRGGIGGRGNELTGQKNAA